MADTPQFKPLRLSEQDMLTKALPDETPGRTDDAVSNVVRDDALQTVDDYASYAEQIESGALNDEIAAEEALFAQKNKPEPPQQEDQGNQPDPPRQEPEPEESNLPPDLQDDDYQGSDPPEIGLYGDVHNNPLFPSQVQPAPKQQTEPEPTAELPASKPEPKEEPPKEEEPEQSPQVRIRGANDIESLALELVNRSRRNGGTLGLEEAIGLAKQTLNGSSSESSDQASPEGFEIPEGMPATVAELEAELDEIDTKEIDLLEAYEYDEVRDLRKRKKELIEFRGQLETASARQQEVYQTAFDSSWDRALSLYPALKDQSGDFYASVRALDEALRDSDDPRYSDPNKPMILAREVANRKGIFPMVDLQTGEGNQAPEKPMAQPSKQLPRKFQAAEPPVPASGNARTNQTISAGSIGGVDPSTLSEDDYLALKERF